MRSDAEIDRNVEKQDSIACASASIEEILGLDSRLQAFETRAHFND
jgi:hypothetical protein